MFANPNLISYDAHVFCSIPRLFVCLRMRMSSSQYANIYVKSIFIGPGSIAGVPFDSVRRFWASLLLHTTCVHLCCNLIASCVAAQQTKNQKKRETGEANTYADSDGTTLVRFHTRLVVRTCSTCFVKHMMTTYQQFPRIRYVMRAV